jgi:serine/threonine-protein kinase HipA
MRRDSFWKEAIGAEREDGSATGSPMTSEPPGTFVFIQLPATGEVVVAGRYELEANPTGHVGYFTYGRSYLARAEKIALDPIHLPLREGTVRTALNRGLFGALRDAAPDFWGRLVIERTHSPGNELEYLLATSDTRVGALSFGQTPEAPALDYTASVPPDELQRAAESAAAIEEGLDGEEPEVLLDPALLAPSTGVGGARPKTVVVDNERQLWIAKFPSRSDRWNNAIAEATYLRLARACGIRVPESRILEVGGRSILLVRRFDQSPGPVRRPFLSAHTLLGLDDSVTDRRGWSYIDLAHALRRVSVSPEDDARELYRRAVFNALTSNTDDHPRNHAVVWEGGGWRLSPAYDMTPSVGRAQDERRLAMAVGSIPGVEPRWANRENIVSSAPHFGLSEDEADALISELKEIVVSRWRELLATVAERPAVAEQIAHAFVDRYPGFEYPAERHA